MNDIHGKEYKIEHFRRPFVHTTVTTWNADGWNPSGIELSVERTGIAVSGWYDSFVGLQGFRLTWEQLDNLRKLEKPS